MNDLPPSIAEIGALTRLVVLWDTAWASGSVSDQVTSSGIMSDAPVLFRHRLTPVLLQVLNTAQPELASDEIRSAVQRHAAGLVARALGVEGAAGPALAALRKARIEVLIMKGPSAARFHKAPATRTWTDIDLLVRPSRFSRALEILQSLGYRRSAVSQQPWNWFDRVCLEGVNLQAGSSRAVDLHHHISPWVFTTQFGADGLFERSLEGNVADEPVRLPSLEDALVVAALHVANDLWKADPSLVTWRDVAVFTSILGRTRTDAAFDRSGLKWFGDLIWRSLEALSGADPVPVAHRENCSLHERAQRRRLELLGWDGDTFAARHPVGWAVRLPLSRAVAFVAGHAIPSPGYARGKHNGYLSYWRDSVSSVREAVKGEDFRRTPVAPHAASVDRPRSVT